MAELAGTYVDDVLLEIADAVLREFNDISKKLFGAIINSSIITSYLKMNLEALQDGSIALSQPGQISRLKLLDTSAKLKKFRSA